MNNHRNCNANPLAARQFARHTLAPLSRVSVFPWWTSSSSSIIKMKSQSHRKVRFLKPRHTLVTDWLISYPPTAFLQGYPFSRLSTPLHSLCQCVIGSLMKGYMLRKCLQTLSSLFIMRVSKDPVRPGCTSSGYCTRRSGSYAMPCRKGVGASERVDASTMKRGSSSRSSQERFALPPRPSLTLQFAPHRTRTQATTQLNSKPR